VASKAQAVNDEACAETIPDGILIPQIVTLALTRG
jgi:hypothetical protein